jgi:hypothetical protein
MAASVVRWFYEKIDKIWRLVKGREEGGVREERLVRERS